MPACDDAFEVRVDALQPTQYCLSAGKLRDAMAWFDFDDPTYEPLEVLEVDSGDRLLLDGHTRAFLAVMAGEDTLRIADATDDVDPDVYLTCREWCRERDVDSIGDWSARSGRPNDTKPIGSAGARTRSATTESGCQFGSLEPLTR